MSERDPIIEAADFVAKKANVGYGYWLDSNGVQWEDLMTDEHRPDMKAVRHAAGPAWR